MPQTYLEGHISIRAALESDSRPIERIYVQRGKYDHHISALKRDAEGIPIDKVDRATIEEMAGGSTHGGVIAAVGVRRLLPLADLPLGDVPYIAMLDGIEDPYNFGYAVRALYAAGCDGVVVRPRNWTTAAGVVARASAGASERIPMAIAETAEEAAEFFRRQGVQVACTGLRGATSLYIADLTGPLFVLIGGERRGITRSFMEAADLVLQIPYGRGFEQSLGTTAAAAVLAFEVMRQRQ